MLCEQEVAALASLLNVTIVVYSKTQTIYSSAGAVYNPGRDRVLSLLNESKHYQVLQVHPTAFTQFDPMNEGDVSLAINMFDPGDIKLPFNVDGTPIAPLPLPTLFCIHCSV